MTENSMSPAEDVAPLDDLLARMTLDEKVAQLTGILPSDLLGPTGLSGPLIEAGEAG